MKQIFKLWMLLVPMALAITACTSNDDNPSDNPLNPTTDELADYTVLIYGTAGGDYDKVMDEMLDKLKAEMDKKVRVAIAYKYATKTEGFSGKYGKPGEVVFFELTSDTDLELMGEQGLELPDAPLYEPESLADAIDIVSEEMPARNFVFLLYGHGGGFNPAEDYPKDEIMSTPTRGVMYDDNLGNCSMNMYEFKQGIELSKRGHVDAIFFHNCVMGNLESLTEIQPCTDYLIASSHELSCDGETIIALIKALQQTDDFEKAACMMADNVYEEWAAGYNGVQKQNGDLKLLEAKSLAPINVLIKQLAERLMALYPTHKDDINQAIDATYRFNEMYILYDLADYARNLADKTGDVEMKRISADLDAAFQQAFIFNKTVNAVPEYSRDTYSLSVVFSCNSMMDGVRIGNWTYGQVYDYCTFSNQTGWGRWLATNEHLPADFPMNESLGL